MVELKELEQRMKKTEEVLKMELAKLRAGRANPALVENIKVNYYGTQMPIKQIASILIPEPRMIVIQPWDKNALPEIEKAIQKSDIGLNPMNDGNVIRLPIPPLSEERRKDIYKLASRITEEHRIAVRNIRREFIEKVKKEEKNGEISEDESKVLQKKIDEITEKYIENLNKLLEDKKKEIFEG